MPKKRMLGQDVVSRMKAKAVVVPFVAKIGPLVDRAIFLETLATHGSAARPELRREAAMLAQEAREDLRHLDLQLAGMPEEVATQNRIADTRRALVAVVDRFERARTSL